MTDRVILKEQRACIHRFHHLELISRRSRCTYEACICGTRRITIAPRGRPDVMWLHDGVFASERLAKVPSNA